MTYHIETVSKEVLVWFIDDYEFVTSFITHVQAEKIVLTESDSPNKEALE
jgi:hypothetical protein